MNKTDLPYCYKIHNLLLDFFEGDEHKRHLWMNTLNPELGDITPNVLIEIGNAHQLLKFIECRLDENKRE